jgi:hypothetical protein
LARPKWGGSAPYDASSQGISVLCRTIFVRVAFVEDDLAFSARDCGRMLCRGLAQLPTINSTGSQRRRSCDMGNSLGLISMLDARCVGETQVRGVIDAQNISVGLHACRARGGWGVDRSVEAHQACDSTAAHRHCRARSGDTEQASAGYAERHDATLKQPAVPAALTEIVMR